MGGGPEPLGLASFEGFFLRVLFGSLTLNATKQAEDIFHGTWYNSVRDLKEFKMVVGIQVGSIFHSWFLLT